MVGTPHRVGGRLPVGRALGVAPPSDTLRALPDRVAVGAVMEAFGYRTPTYRLGKLLAQQRRVLEGLWAATRSKA